MNTENLFVAKVISNQDLKKEGRVKIFVESIMSGWSKNHLPWARGWSNGTGGSSNFGLSMIPETDSLIWVFCEKPQIRKNWYYLSSFEESKINPHSSFSSTVGSNSTYPNMKFLKLKNGITIGADSSDSNPEIIIQHPKGASFFINNSGKLIFKTSIGDYEINTNTGNINLKTTAGDISLNSGSKKLEFKNNSQNLKTILNSILSAIQAITVPTALGPSGTPINSTQFSTENSNVNQLLK